MAQGVSLGDSDLDTRLSKSDTLEKIDFEASVERGIQAIFKKEDDFVIWGPASVEIVDKEGDKISVEALDKALPQLLRRARLSLEHSDQIAGRILERFETEDPVTVEINGQTYKRQEFPTAVLDLDDGEPPALYVAGEVFNDTQQSKRAREQIEEGELTSYSISGEALVTRKKVDNGTVYDDIIDIDLSAVTLCEEGMNQGASYAKVEGELSDKELAGEANSEDVQKREEIPVLEHPSMQGVEASAVSKNMTNDDNGGSEEESQTAEKDGLTQEDVSKAVENALPDGDLATTKYVDQVIDERLDDGEQANKDGSSPADGENAEAGDVNQAGDTASDDGVEDVASDQEPNQGGDSADTSGQETTSSKSASVAEARDKLAREFGVETEKVNDALNNLLAAQDEPVDTADEEDIEDPDGDGDQELEVTEEGDEVEESDDEEEEAFGEEETDEVEEQDDAPTGAPEGAPADEGGDEDLMAVLEEQLPEDVYDVVCEYIDKETAEELARSLDDGSDGSSEEGIEKTVQDVLQGGAEVQGGQAIPTDPNDDQVDKQYSGNSDGPTGAAAEDSPALANWY